MGADNILVKGQFFTLLRDVTQTKRDEMTRSRATTVEELVALLAKKCGRNFCEYTYNAARKLKLQLKYLVKGRRITCLNGVTTRLPNEDVVAIIPLVSRG